MITELDDKVPKFGVAEKVTFSPESGFPFKVTLVAISEIMVEPAATVDGAAEIEIPPEEIVIEVDFDTSSQVAVTIAVPKIAPGPRVTVAIPSEFVLVVEGMSNPMLVVKVTGTSIAGSPIISRTITDIVEVILEFAAMIVGEAVISI